LFTGLRLFHSVRSWTFWRIYCPVRLFHHVRLLFFGESLTQNLHWKLGRLTPSFGSILAVWLKKYFFRNKTFLFFKIKSWNFQHLFEMEFCETSQNFNSFSLFRQLLFSFFLSVVRFHEIPLQNDYESFSFLSWKTKDYIAKKKIFKPLSISKQKSFVYQSNFQWRFCSYPVRIFHTKMIYHQRLSIKVSATNESTIFFQLLSYIFGGVSFISHQRLDPKIPPRCVYKHLKVANNKWKNIF
jgi:hypothetical protein